MSGYHVVARDPLVLRIEANTLGELFEDAAFAVFDQGYRLDEIPGTYSRPVVAPGDTAGELLANWIDELLAMSRVEGIAPSYFVVDRLEEGGVQGAAAGLPLSEAPRRGPAVVRLLPPEPDPVPIPNGWWVDITVELEDRLRVV